MPCRALQLGLPLALCLLVGGCAFPGFWNDRRDKQLLAPKPANKTESASKTEPGKKTDSANKTEPAKSAATSTAAATPAKPGTGTDVAKPADGPAMGEVLMELQKVGALEPAAAAQLTEDLKHTDPTLWPQTIESFRATLAYRKQVAERAAASKPASVNPSLAVDQPAKPALPQPATVQPPAVQSAPVQSAAVPTAPAASFTTTARILPANRPAETPPASVVNVDPAVRPAINLTPAAGSSLGAAAATPGTVTPGIVTPAIVTPAIPRIEFADPSTTDATDVNHPVRLASATKPIDKPNDKPADKSPEKSTDAVAPQADLWPTATDGAVTLVGRPAGGSELDWHEHLGASIQRLERETADVPGNHADLNRHVALRMMYLISGRRDDALRPIPGIGPVQQDFWSKEFFGLSAYLDSQGITDPARRAAEAASHLHDAAQRLSESGVLLLKNMAFCSEVKSFGVYKKFEKYEFKPDQAVILYAEVQNFKIDSTDRGYHTAMRGSYQILDSRGNRVAEHEYPVAEEYCQNPRRDFFFPLILTLPHRINDGDYTLQLSLEDTQSQKLAQSSVQFSIKEQAK